MENTKKFWQMPASELNTREDELFITFNQDILNKYHRDREVAMETFNALFEQLKEKKPTYLYIIPTVGSYHDMDDFTDYVKMLREVFVRDNIPAELHDILEVIYIDHSAYIDATFGCWNNAIGWNIRHIYGNMEFDAEDIYVALYRRLNNPDD